MTCLTIGVLTLFFFHCAFSSEDICETKNGSNLTAAVAQWTKEGDCKIYFCTEEGKVSEKGCPVYKLRAGCHMSQGDVNQTYPHCCPQPECPRVDDGNV